MHLQQAGSMDDAAVWPAGAAQHSLRCVIRTADIAAADGDGALPAALPNERIGQAAGHLNIHQVQVCCAARSRPASKEEAQAPHAPRDHPAASAETRRHTCNVMFCIALTQSLCYPLDPHNF